MRKVLLAVFVLGAGLALAYHRLRPVAPAAPARLGTINGKAVPVQKLLDVSGLQIQELYHEMVLRQLITEKAEELKIPVSSNPPRKELAQVLGKVLVGRLTPAQKQHFETICREGTEQFELEMMLVEPESRDYVASVVTPASFEEISEQFSKEQSRFERGRIGTLTAAEIEKRFGVSALAACRALKLKEVSKPLSNPGGALFLRVLARGQGKARPLEQFLVTQEGWSNVRSWASEANLDIPVYKHDEATMHSIYNFYLSAASSP